jgi:HAD superfamily hydrolase (TIGR01509 family)
MQRVPVPFDAVIFDNDGLLLDTEDAWTRAETALFERHGRTFTAEHKRALLGTARDVATAKMEAFLGLEGQADALYDELHELVMAEAAKGVAPRPGALELLAALREAAVPVGVASNSSREFVESVLGVARLLDGHFDAVVTVEDVPSPKPAPDIYLATCEALGAAPGRSAALEDSATGVASAAAAGLFVIGVPYFPGTDLPGASLVAGSLADLSVSEALGLASPRSQRSSAS